jgi:hypothetical protein
VALFGTKKFNGGLFGEPASSFTAETTTIATFAVESAIAVTFSPETSYSFVNATVISGTYGYGNYGDGDYGEAVNP